MFIVDFSDKTIRYLFFKKTLLGKFEIENCGLVDTQEPNWEDQLYQVLKSQKVALILPEYTSRVIRFEAPSGISQETIQEKVEKEIAGSSGIENFAYDCGMRKDDQGNSQIMCLATPNRDLVDIFSLVQDYDAKPTLAVPESLATFRILRDGIIEGEIVLLIDLEDESTNFIFFDTTGPVFKFTEPTDLTRLDTTTKKIIARYQDQMQQEINRIVLTGEKSSQIDPFEFRKSVDILTIKADDILKDRIAKLDLKFDSGQENISRYLSAIGAGLLTQESTTLNLVKNDALMNVEKEAMKHTSDKDEPSEVNEFKDADDTPTEKSKRPQLMAEDIETATEFEEKTEVKREFISDSPSAKKVEPEVEMEKQTMSHTIGSPDSQFRSSFRADDAKKSTGAKKKILLFVIVALIVAILAGVILFFLGGSATAPDPEPTPPSESTPTPTQAPELDRADLTLEVLNGSGEAGVAGDVASALEDLGYPSPISTGNADAYDYEETVIQLQEEFADFFEMLKEDLENEGYTVADDYEELDDDATTGGVVIVGTLNENQADEDVTPTPEEDEDVTPTPKDE